MLNFMKSKKTKTYEFTNLGLTQCKYDIKMEKSNKINKITGFGIVILFMLLGYMSKEFVALYLVNLGIGATTDLFVNK